MSEHKGSSISSEAAHLSLIFRDLSSARRRRPSLSLLAASISAWSLLLPSVIASTALRSIVNRHLTLSSISPRALGFLIGDGSRQEPAVSRLADGLPQKPALGFNSFWQIPDKIQNSLKVHFGRFLKKDAAGRGMNAKMPSEMGKELRIAAAEVSLDRRLQAWRNNPSWTDKPPEIKICMIICSCTLLSQHQE